jgi:hypothetical protein
MLVNSGIIIPYLFIFASISARRLEKVFDLSHPHGLFRAIAILSLISANFMTISWNTYNPVCLDPRHILFLIPIASIAALHFFKSKHHNKEIKLMFLIAIVGLWSFRIENTLFFKVYLPLLIGVSAFIYMNKENRFKNYLLFIALATCPISLIISAKDLQYNDQRAFIHDHIKADANIHIYTHKVEERLYKFENKFEPTNITWHNINDIILADHSLENYILQNKHSRILSGERTRSLKDFQLKKVAENRPLGIIIYKIKN